MAEEFLVVDDWDRYREVITKNPFAWTQGLHVVDLAANVSG